MLSTSVSRALAFVPAAGAGLARRFTEFMVATQAQAVLAKYGFGKP